MEGKGKGKMCHGMSAQCPDSTDRCQKLLLSPYSNTLTRRSVTCSWKYSCLMPSGRVVSGTLQSPRGQARPKEAHTRSPRQGPVPRWCASNLVQRLLGAQPRCGTDIMIPFYFFSTDFFRKSSWPAVSVKLARVTSPE